MQKTDAPYTHAPYTHAPYTQAPAARRAQCSPCSGARVLGGVLLVVTLLLWGPVTVASEPARVAGPDPLMLPALPALPALPTLPALPALSTNATRRPGAGDPIARPAAPLTRALVQARIEAIDPTDWLARFGRVEQLPARHR